MTLTTVRWLFVDLGSYSSWGVKFQIKKVLFVTIIVSVWVYFVRHHTVLIQRHYYKEVGPGDEVGRF